MKTVSRTATMVGLVAICLVIGFCLGQWASRQRYGFPAPTRGAQHRKGTKPHDATHFPTNAVDTAYAQKLAGLLQLPLTRKSNHQESISRERIAQELAWTKPEDCRILFAMLEEIPVSTERNSLVAIIAGRWAELDPKAAASYVYVVSLSSEWIRSTAIQEICIVWTKNDPAAALAWAESTEQGPIAFVLSTWAALDPVAVASKLDALHVGTTHGWVCQNLLEPWTAKDPEAALQWARNQTDMDSKREYTETILSEWANRDPKSASQHLHLLPDNENKVELIRRLAATWAETDRVTALQWTESLEGERTRMRAIRAMLGPWASSDLDGARKYVEGLPLKLQQDLRWIVANEWASENPDAAMEWVTDLPESGGREYALKATIRAWVNVDLASASHWAEQLAEGVERNSMMAEMGSFWAATEDSKTVAAWLESLPEASSRDSALAGVAASKQRSDPHEAIRLAGTISDEKFKRETILQIARNWFFWSPLKAKAWVASADLPETVKAELAKELGKFGIDLENK